MSAKMEYKGKDVAEAILVACEKLNVNREELDIEILETGSAGVFGLCRKKARIKVSFKEKGVKNPGKNPGKIFSREALAGKDSRSRPANGPKRRFAPAEQVVISADTIDTIKNDLDQILGLMGLSATSTVVSEGGKIKANIVGNAIEEIVGTEGQTLDSLQFLLRKIITRKFSEKIVFTLDAGDYRKNRARELEEMSIKLADEVKETGKTLSIPALNPAERRIVHMTLQDDSAIRSRSVGEGLFKKILIYVPGRGRKKNQKKGKSSFAGSPR